MLATETPIGADPREAEQIRALAERIAARGDRVRYSLVDTENQVRQEIPAPLFEILVAAARELANGRSVVILHYDQEITTQQAADILQVSRPYFVRLLEEGKIPYHRVGTHRRIRMGDLLRYKEIRDERRHADLKELVRASEVLGLYDDDGEGSEESADRSPHGE
jgi:excisionase family DNA binding protein